MGTPPFSHSQLVFTCKALTEIGIPLSYGKVLFTKIHLQIYSVWQIPLNNFMFKMDLHPFPLYNLQFGHKTESLPVAL